MTSRKVAIVIYDGVQALDVTGPADVFAEANRFLASEQHYQVLLIAADYQPVRSSSGVLLTANLDFNAASAISFDILLVAGSPELVKATEDAELIAWVAQAAQRSLIYGAICTGAFVLGYAGLLNQRRVTTHWQHTALLMQRFPQALVEPDSIHIQDGALITSAGVTAGIDLALALVAQAHGNQLATAVAKQLVVVLQRMGGQSQFSPFLAVPADETSVVNQIQTLILADLKLPHQLPELAAAVGMSARSLSRYFQKELGISPHEFVQRARLDSARKLLEGTLKPLKTIAFECGFVSSDRMRMVFRGELCEISCQLPNQSVMRIKLFS